MKEQMMLPVLLYNYCNSSFPSQKIYPNLVEVFALRNSLRDELDILSMKGDSCLKNRVPSTAILHLGTIGLDFVSN